TGTPHRHLGRWGPASLARPRAFPTADAAALRRRTTRPTAPGGAPCPTLIGRSTASTVESTSSTPRPIRSTTRRRDSPRIPSAAPVAEPAAATPPLGAPTTTTSVVREAMSGRSTDRTGSISPSCARPAAIRLRCHSDRGWIARSTARTASGRSARTDEKPPLLPRAGAWAPARPCLDPEPLAGAKSFTAASAPDGDPRRAVDLPSALVSDDRRVLVDP